MSGFQNVELTNISSCEVCGASALKNVLDLGLHPLCDDLVEVGDDRQSQEYPIQLSFCDTCQTVHQNHQIPKQTLFPKTYHYRARHTADVLIGMRQLVDRCELELGSLDGLTALDIGCNDGSLLSIFSERGVTTIGVEPTSAAGEARSAGHNVYEEFLTPDLAKKIVDQHGSPQIITFTNVFAHIENLSEVLESLRILLAKGTLLVIENHYLGAVLDKFQFDTFYHEHPRTYSRNSFGYISKSLGHPIVATEFPSRYGGNIRVLMRITDKKHDEGISPAEDEFEQRLIEMNVRIPLWREAKRAKIDALVKVYGPLPAKAFPGRAAILVRLLGLDHQMVSAVYEKPGSMKIGHYVPGTRIPILSDDEFAARPKKDSPLINFAWHISTEIHKYMRSNGFEGVIVDLFSQEEFETAK